MDVRNIAVVVEDVDAARTALIWALHNIIRYGDIITLLHVYPFTRSKTKNKARLLRLKGFHLALSFQDICNNFSNTKVEIVVTEDDREGMKIVATVREIGASMLVVGLHDHSFLYNLAMGHNSIGSYFNCRVLAIKQQPESPLSTMVSAVGVLDSSTEMDFSQIHISRLQVPDTPPPKEILKEKVKLKGRVNTSSSSVAD
ncbi:UspA [Sesbania bispinosa]|nr:UspA [Sesbania bispinosa]